jgi:hypothetical protein
MAETLLLVNIGNSPGIEFSAQTWEFYILLHPMAQAESKTAYGICNGIKSVRVPT